MSLTPEPPGSLRVHSSVLEGSTRNSARPLTASRHRCAPRVLTCRAMRCTDAFQIRIGSELRDRLGWLRHQPRVNPGALSRELIAATVARELPADLKAPKRQPLTGSRSSKLGCGGALCSTAWHGSARERPAPISITDTAGTPASRQRAHASGDERVKTRARQLTHERTCTRRQTSAPQCEPALPIRTPRVATEAPQTGGAGRPPQPGGPSPIDDNLTLAPAFCANSSRLPKLLISNRPTRY